MLSIPLRYGLEELAGLRDLAENPARSAGMGTNDAICGAWLYHSADTEMISRQNGGGLTSVSSARVPDKGGRPTPDDFSSAIEGL